jgi:hypothetical protein
VVAPSSIASAAAVGIVASLGLAMVAAGCSHDTDASALFDEAGAADGAPIDNSPKITVTTLAPIVTSAPAVKASGQWAAYSLDDGEWQTVLPSAEGTYRFPVPAAKWAFAVACASNDDALSTVFVHRRTKATLAADVTLEDFCVPPAPPPQYAIAGNLLHVPTTTTWLDFGYARDWRGDALPSNGNTVPYEEVGIASGTWDFMFGIRDDSAGKPTRFIMRRGETISADRMLDVDVTGPGSFAPTTRPFVMHGIVAGDTVEPQIVFATGGPYGIQLGPDDVPADKADVSLVYITIPDAMQIASDRYRGTLTAEQDRRYGGRGITFDFHQAMDLDVTFLPEARDPVVKVASKDPIRFETTFPVLANAVRHEVRALAMINRRTQHAWQASYDAASLAGAAQVVDTMPDLTHLAGWKPDWNLPPGQFATVLATAFETSRTFGDGTMQRTAGKAIELDP